MLNCVTVSLFATFLPFSAAFRIILFFFLFHDEFLSPMALVLPHLSIVYCTIYCILESWLPEFYLPLSL